MEADERKARRRVIERMLNDTRRGNYNLTRGECVRLVLSIPFGVAWLVGGFWHAVVQWIHVESCARAEGSEKHVFSRYE